MFTVENYYKTAEENEEIFRNILKDLREHRATRPMGMHIPKKLDTKSSLEDIFEKYSKGQRAGKFTIFSFSRPDMNTARIGFKDITFMSGGGAQLEYEITHNNQVKYTRSLGIFMS